MKTYLAKSLSALAVIGLVGYMGLQKASAADATADATQVVTAAIAIVKDSDLDFGSAVAGDALKTVAPGAAENAENASFTVTGEPSTAYTITLPADGTVSMVTGGGGANETIAVDSFASFPATTGTLDGAGSQALFVGASRAALGVAQVPGNYAATFTVTVVY